MSIIPVVVFIPSDNEYETPSTVIRVEKAKWENVKDALLKVLSEWRDAEIYFENEEFLEKHQERFSLSACCASFILFLLILFIAEVIIDGIFPIMTTNGYYWGETKVDVFTRFPIYLTLIVAAILSILVGFILVSGDKSLDWISVSDSHYVYVEVRLEKLELTEFLDDLAATVGYDITKSSERDLWICKYCGHSNERTLKCSNCGAKRL